MENNIKIYSFEEIYVSKIKSVRITFLKLDRYLGWWACIDRKYYGDWITSEEVKDGFDILRQQAKSIINTIK